VRRPGQRDVIRAVTAGRCLNHTRARRIEAVRAGIGGRSRLACSRNSTSQPGLSQDGRRHPRPAPRGRVPCRRSGRQADPAGPNACTCASTPRGEALRFREDAPQEAAAETAASKRRSRPATGTVPAAYGDQHPALQRAADPAGRLNCRPADSGSALSRIGLVSVQVERKPDTSARHRLAASLLGEYGAAGVVAPR